MWSMDDAASPSASLGPAGSNDLLVQPLRYGEADAREKSRKFCRLAGAAPL
jgi:hypothetical protein